MMPSHSFTTNPNRIPVGGTRCGFLKLHVQTIIQNDTVTFRLTRPSERLPPAPVVIVFEKPVTF